MTTYASILAWRISQRRLEGCSPWGRKESDTSEQLSLHTCTRITRPEKEGWGSRAQNSVNSHSHGSEVPGGKAVPVHPLRGLERP